MLNCFKVGDRGDYACLTYAEDWIKREWEEAVERIHKIRDIKKELKKLGD